ncbi:hypothetical protein [Chitinolyticbacter albus]|uniref:hypothetical protein n=1 Tax=Chitinolyticbacter albus TaxID=2961951 RepID=UPI00210D4BED|nr:hypothetical protein [Chitinolyticbacter albus]
MTQYFQIRRQFIALGAGTAIAIPLALVGAILTPTDPDAPSFAIGPMGHTPVGPILLLLIAAIRFLGFAANMLNYLAIVLAVVVATSLIHDAVKLKLWRTNKSASLLGQALGTVGAWYFLVSSVSEPIVLAIVPLLSVLAGLFVALVALVLCRDLGKTEEVHA